MVADALGSTSATQGSAYDFFVILSRFHDIISRREPSCSTNTNNTSRLGPQWRQKQNTSPPLCQGSAACHTSFRYWVSQQLHNMRHISHMQSLFQQPQPMNHGISAREYRGSPLIYLRGCHTCHLPSSTFHAKISWLNSHLYAQSHSLCRQSLNMRLRRLSSRIRIEHGVAS